MTDKETERLSICKPVEVRAGSGNSRSIGGYAAVFNRPSQNFGTFVERVSPCCFNKSRADGWNGVIARYNHDDNYLLGATRNGTLRLSIDEIGLDYTVDVPESRSDVLELVQRGDVGNSSFAFQVYQDDWGMSDQGFPLRSLISARLIDVAPVCEPAYPDSTVGLRSLAKHLGVPYEDVAKLSKENELRKFFVRTDRRSLSGAEAKARIMTKAAGGRAVPITPREALRRSLAKRYPPGTLASLDPRLAKVRMMGKRWPDWALRD